MSARLVKAEIRGRISGLIQCKDIAKESDKKAYDDRIMELEYCIKAIDTWLPEQQKRNAMKNDIMDLIQFDENPDGSLTVNPSS